MTFEQWRTQRKFYPVKQLSEEFRCGLMIESSMVHKNDVVIAYPDKSHIEIVNGVFQLIIGSSSWDSFDLNEIERILWNNHAKDNFEKEFDKEVKELFVEGYPDVIGAHYAHHLLESICEMAPKEIVDNLGDLYIFTEEALNSFCLVINNHLKK